jgi:MFS family permease
LQSWQLLRKPRFREYFIGSLVSNMGTWLQGTAQTLLAYKATHSALAVGLVTAAQFAGFLIVGPWAGTYATRMGQKGVLIGAQVISAIVAIVLAVAQASGYMTPYWLVAGAFIIGLASTFALPVQNAMVSALAEQKDAKGVMAMNSVSYNAGRTVSPILYLFVLVSLGAEAAFAINALTFVFFAYVIRRVYPGPGEIVEQVRWPERRWSGMRLAVRRPRLMLLLAMVAAITIADDPVQVLGPEVAGRVLHTSSSSTMWSAYFLAALGLGSVVGSSVLPWMSSTGVPWLTRKLPGLLRLRRRRQAAERSASSTESRHAALPLAVLAVSVVTFAFGLNRWLSLIAVVVAGVAALLTGASAQALLQQTAPPQNRTQVMALWAVAWAGTKPIASLADGWLASTFNVRTAAIALAMPAALIALLELFLTDRQRQALKARATRRATSEPGPGSTLANLRSVIHRVRRPVEPARVLSIAPLPEGLSADTLRDWTAVIAHVVLIAPLELFLTDRPWPVRKARATRRAAPEAEPPDPGAPRPDLAPTNRAPAL